MTAILERSTTIPEPSRHHPPGPDFATIASPPRSRYRSGFWLAAAAFLIAMAFSTIPTPLYVLYQQRDGFSSFVVPDVSVQLSAI